MSVCGSATTAAPEQRADDRPPASEFKADLHAENKQASTDLNFSATAARNAEQLIIDEGCATDPDIRAPIFQSTTTTIDPVGAVARAREPSKSPQGPYSTVEDHDLITAKITA